MIHVFPSSSSPDPARAPGSFGASNAPSSNSPGTPFELMLGVSSVLPGSSAGAPAVSPHFSPEISGDAQNSASSSEQGSFQNSGNATHNKFSRTSPAVPSAKPAQANSAIVVPAKASEVPPNPVASLASTPAATASIQKEDTGVEGNLENPGQPFTKAKSGHKQQMQQPSGGHVVMEEPVIAASPAGPAPILPQSVVAGDGDGTNGANGTNGPDHFSAPLAAPSSEMKVPANVPQTLAAPQLPASAAANAAQNNTAAASAASQMRDYSNGEGQVSMIQIDGGINSGSAATKPVVAPNAASQAATQNPLTAHVPDARPGMQRGQPQMPVSVEQLSAPQIPAGLRHRTAVAQSANLVPVNAEPIPIALEPAPVTYSNHASAVPGKISNLHPGPPAAQSPAAAQIELKTPTTPAGRQWIQSAQLISEIRTASAILNGQSIRPMPLSTPTPDWPPAISSQVATANAAASAFVGGHSSNSIGPAAAAPLVEPPLIFINPASQSSGALKVAPSVLPANPVMPAPQIAGNAAAVTSAAQELRGMTIFKAPPVGGVPVQVPVASSAPVSPLTAIKHDLPGAAPDLANARSESSSAPNLVQAPMGAGVAPHASSQSNRPSNFVVPNFAPFELAMHLGSPETNAPVAPAPIPASLNSMPVVEAAGLTFQQNAQKESPTGPAIAAHQLRQESHVSELPVQNKAPQEPGKPSPSNFSQAQQIPASSGELNSGNERQTGSGQSGEQNRNPLHQPNPGATHDLGPARPGQSSSQIVMENRGFLKSESSAAPHGNLSPANQSMANPDLPATSPNLHGKLGNAASPSSGTGDAQQSSAMAISADSERQSTWLGKNLPSHGKNDFSLPLIERSAPVVDRREALPAADIPGFMGLPVESSPQMEPLEIDRAHGSQASPRLTSEMWSAVEQFRAAGSRDWNVRIRPGEGTELTLRLRIQNEKLVVQARLESGHWDSVAANWEELQAVLADRGIHLEALEPGHSMQSHEGNFNPLGSNGNSGKSGLNRETDSEEGFLPNGAEWAEAAAEAEEEVTAKAPPSSGAAWETWA